MDLQSFLTFVPSELRGRRMRPYYYPIVTSAVIAGGGTASPSVSIQNVSAFFLTRISGRVYTNAAPETSVADPAFTIEVKFSSGDDLTFGPSIWSGIVGDTASSSEVAGGALEIPRLIPGGSTITTVLANYTAATSYWVRLLLGGVNVYNS